LIFTTMESQSKFDKEMSKMAQAAAASE